MQPSRRLLRLALLLSLSLLASAPAAALAAARPPTPTITITTPAAGAQYTQNQGVYADYGCFGTGTVTCTGAMGNGTSVPNGAPIQTNTLGTKTFTVRSTSTVNGRSSSASKSVKYTVVAAPPVQYVLAVAKAGVGSGTVASSPTGIDCGGACSASYNSGTVVALTASATSGSAFAGWAGACSGTGPCSVTMSAAQTVTATFNVVPQFALTVAKSGAGTGTVASSPAGIDCGSACSANYNSGMAVTLTATAGSGSTFAGWSGACSGTSTCSVTMSAAQGVSAAFDVAPPPPPGCENGYVGLTYDDGPTSMTQQYINALSAGGARATFFLLGNQMQSFPAMARAEVAAGNAIGDHTMDHKSFTGQSDGLGGLTDSQIVSEIQGQANLAQSQVGYTENLFRPPYGDMNQHTFDLVTSLGFTSVMWTYDTNDWKNPTTSAIVNGVLSNARDQAVVLMHDGHTNTLNAIPGILSGLKSMGLCPGEIVPDPTNADNQFDYNGLPMNLKVIAWNS